MRSLQHILLSLLLVGVLATYVAAASAPTYCKCTCFKNSTLIQLGPKSGGGDSPPDSSFPLPPPPDSDSDPDPDPGTPDTGIERDTTPEERNEQQHLRRFLPFADPGHDHDNLDLEKPRRDVERRAASASCTQCTRAFCLAQHLPICKDAEENDVVAMCFQRDSRKDQIIVWGFILGTAGLLSWAAAKRVVEMRDGHKKSALFADGGNGVLGTTGFGGAVGSRGGRDAARDRGEYIPVSPGVRPG